MHNLAQNIKGVNLIPAYVRGAITEGLLTTTGTAVDLAGEGRKVAVALSIGAVGTGTNTISIVIQESANNSTWTTLDATSFVSVGTTGLTTVDLTPTKRYIRAVATIRETNTILISFAVLGVVYNVRAIPTNVA